MNAANRAPRRSSAGADLNATVEAIRSAILSGEYAPNQRLVEIDLEQEFGASRTAVRAALAELAVEELVERIPNKGARVRAVSVDEAIEITEVRRAVESLCAGKAAELVSEEEIRELRRIADEMERAVAAGDLLGYSEHNRRLHERIIAISAHRPAAAVLSRLRGQNVRHQFRLAMQAGRPAVSLPEHLAIVEAICRRDPAAASAAMSRHLDSVIGALRDSAG